MKEDILNSISHPVQLEKLYRDNKSSFKKEFNLLYPELKGNPLAEAWHTRLNYEGPEISWGSKNELLFILIASILAGILAKIPAIFSIEEEFFYTRNTALIIFPILSAYFIFKNKTSYSYIGIAALVFLISVIFINLLPAANNSDTSVLSILHLPLVLWSVLGFVYVGNHITSNQKRLEFLRYNGELIIMSGLILIAGGILTGITIGLFEVIGLKIEKFYFDYVGIFGLMAVPVVATYLTQTNPQLVNKVSPVIAKIFSPLVLIMLTVYLCAIFVSGKDPYNDRNFLLIFNVLLIGVLAIILFSIAESLKQQENRTGSYILLALSFVTVIVNGIALSAILFRISEWGFTPNRLAVLGTNILILTNLFVVTYHLFKSVTRKAEMNAVENSIAQFLPVYILWAAIVTFIFPFIFSFV